jgi:hypothetical protein
MDSEVTILGRGRGHYGKDREKKEGVGNGGLKEETGRSARLQHQIIVYKQLGRELPLCGRNGLDYELGYW